MISTLLKKTHLIGVSSLLLVATGCASVKVSIPGFDGDDDVQTASSLSERVTLAEASQSLGEKPWGEKGTNSMVSVLFGGMIEGEADQALNEYLDDVRGRGGDPATAIVADADVSLSYARHVAEAGRQAALAITPVPSDIDTLETAIADARECREMYVKALRSLEADGVEISRAEMSTIRDAFTQTMEDIGQTADIVAYRLANEQPRERFAQPALIEAP